MKTLLKLLLSVIILFTFQNSLQAQSTVYDIYIKVYSDDILEKIEKPTYRIHFLTDKFYVLEGYKNHKVIERGQWKKEGNKYFLKKRIRYASSASKQKNAEIEIPNDMKIKCNEVYDCKTFKVSLWKKAN